MVKPESLIVGHAYFRVTYPEATLTKPIVGSYSYVGTEKLSEPDEVGYLFKFMPPYAPPETGALIAFSRGQLDDLNNIEGLISELAEVKIRIKGTASEHLS